MYKKIIYTILSIQESFLKKKLSKTLEASYKSKRKQHFLKGCQVSLNTQADEEKESIESEIKLILKTNNYNPQKILKYIEKQGTEIIYNKNAKKILNSINENEGFIYPTRGLKAIYLNFSLKHQFNLKTQDMFILSHKENINKYYFIYNFYNWYAFKHYNTSLDTESQILLKKFLYSNTSTKELQLTEIYKLKEAITQDKSAIEFVIKLCRNYEGTKQALTKMNLKGSATL